MWDVYSRLESNGTHEGYAFENTFDTIVDCMKYIKHEIYMDSEFNQENDKKEFPSCFWFEECSRRDDRIISPTFTSLKDVNLFESGFSINDQIKGREASNV